MSVVAEAQIEIDLPVSEAFARFRDFDGWRRWMPRTFTPVRGPGGALAVGDRITVRLGGALPTQLTVVRVRDDTELAWRGGVIGILVGEHSFLFEDLGGGRTRILSREPFEGLLARLPRVARGIERGASRAGAEILRAFAAHIA